MSVIFLCLAPDEADPEPGESLPPQAARPAARAAALAATAMFFARMDELLSVDRLSGEIASASGAGRGTRQRRGLPPRRPAARTAGCRRSRTRSAGRPG